MAERRDRLQIIIDILNLMQRKGGRLKPTHILYGGNLSYDRLKKYIAELEEKNLIIATKVKNKTFYEITDRGLNFIAEARKIKEITEAFGF